MFRAFTRRASAVSRQQELLADRLAAEITTPAIAVEALVAIELLGLVLDDIFWPRIFQRIERDGVPSCNPFSEMGPQIWDAVEDRQQLLDRLLARDTSASDTHPALRDRLAAVGRPPHWPDTLEKRAADYFFGSQKEELAAVLDRQWHDAHGREWTTRHDEIRTRRERLAKLAALRSPTPEQIYERGRLTESEEDENAALELYMSAHEQGHAAAGLAAGRILLDREDASGIALIDGVMDADPGLIEEGCTAVIDFLDRRGRLADAHQYQVRMTRDTTKMSMVRAERTELSVVDRLHPCADAGVDVAGLCRRIASEPGVLRAFLATKELRYSRGTQTVLAVVAKNGVAPDLRERLCREGVLPDHVTVVTLGRHDRKLETALREVSGSLIYDSSR